MADPIILCKALVNLISVLLHIAVLLIIACTPSLKCGGFDELFFSQNLGDVVAVILRVITVYAPALILSNHSVVIQADRDTIPLATITNAVSWYTSYVVIFSALTFGLDRAVMVVSLRSYSWAGSTYDAIDMIFETLFYVPLLCMLNGFSIVVLYSRWKTLHKKRFGVEVGTASKQLPTISTLCAVGLDNDMVNYVPSIRLHNKDLRKERMLRRLEVELSFAIIAVIDAQIDFLCVLFYTLYWGGYSGYVDVNDTLFYELYSYFFELGNIISPYILLCFFPNLRREFGRRFKPSCGNSIDDFFD